MKLTDIKTFVVGNPPPHYGGRYFVFVRLTTDSRVDGIGEAYCVPFDPHLVEKLIVDVFQRYLHGQDPHHIEAKPSLIARARSAIARAARPISS